MDCWRLSDASSRLCWIVHDTGGHCDKRSDTPRRDRIGRLSGSDCFRRTGYGRTSGSGSPESHGTHLIRKVYAKGKAFAGGRWHSRVAMVNAEGALQPIIEDDADFVINAYSVQKISVAMTVLDKVDRGLLRLGVTTLELDVSPANFWCPARRCPC